MSDRRNSERARKICLETHGFADARGDTFMTCSCGCNFVFNVATTAWRADHARRWAEGGRDTSDNLYPIMVKHDAGVGGKAADDTREIAKGKRNRLKHMGVKKRKGPPMAGSRDSKFKRKMDGSVERR